MDTSSISTTAKTTATATTIADIHSDILQTQILTRLDGPSLASAACASSQLYALGTQESLWANVCHSTWPSTNTPRLHHIISSFPNGPCSFFSDSFPLHLPSTRSSYHKQSPSVSNRPSQLISAVDIFYRGNLIFSKVVETETVSGWFLCSPFRIDMLDLKDVIPTPIRYPSDETTCLDLGKDLTLSWIMIDPFGQQAMNLSSYEPVSVQRHWLSGEVQVRFASVLGGEKGRASEYVHFGIVLTCGGSEGGELHVREVSMQVEDMDGMHLNGKESLAIMGRALEGRNGRKMKRERGVEGGRRRYQEFLGKKRERKERKVRTEGRLDMLCVGFGVLGFATFWLVVLFR